MSGKVAAGLCDRVDGTFKIEQPDCFFASPKVKTFRDLICWQRSMEWAEKVYLLSKSFPDSERFGLTGQIRRAVVSVLSNIAEGFGRSSTQQHLQIAQGSLFEVETQLDLAERLELIVGNEVSAAHDFAREVERLLRAMMRYFADLGKSPFATLSLCHFASV